ncbi:hypothetical protein Tco_0668407 [Tanacetum coccineum]
MPTKMELTLEQTQQGVSYEVSISEWHSYVLTMKMEILLEPTSTSSWEMDQRWEILSEILLKLNLSDQGNLKKVDEGNTNYRTPMVFKPESDTPGFPSIKTSKTVSIQIKEIISTKIEEKNFNQNRNFNQGQVYQPSTIQPPVYQAPTQQMQGVSKTNFENYVKANDAVTFRLLLFLPPVVFNPLKEPEQNLETSMDKVQKPSLENTAQVPPPEEEESIFMKIPKPNAKKTVNIEIQEPNSPKPTSYQPKLPYPERMKNLLIERCSRQNAKIQKMIKPRLPKEQRGSLKNRHYNRECWILCLVIHNKVPEKLEDPGKFLILCALQELDRTRRPFLRTAKALIDLYEEKLTLRVGSDELVFYAEKSEKSKNKQFAHAISVIDFSKDKPFSCSTTTHSDALPPSSSLVKTSDNLEEFTDELTLLKKDVHFQVYSNPLFEFDDNFTSSNVNPLFNEMNEDVENKNSNVLDSDEPVLLNTRLSDKVECFAPENDIDEIDAFLAMKVSSNLEEGYFDSEGDVIFLENLLSDNTTHNLAPEVISDHEPEQNES